MNTPDDGLIEARLLLTPQQTRVVRAVAEAMRSMSDKEQNLLETVIASAIDAIKKLKPPGMP
jgi:hypothetical protein